jgi:hypothetical protein
MLLLINSRNPLSLPRIDTFPIVFDTHETLRTLVTNPLIPVAKIGRVVASFTVVGATTSSVIANGVVRSRSHHVDVVDIGILVLVVVGHLAAVERPRSPRKPRHQLKPNLQQDQNLNKHDGRISVDLISCSGSRSWFRSDIDFYKIVSNRK